MNLKKLILLDKKIKCGTKYYSFSQKVISEILQIVNKYNEKNLEVGGYVFSEEKLKDSFHGIWTSKPYMYDVFKRHSYYLDISNEQRNININSKKGLIYSCVWHSHKDKSTKPSSTDNQNIKNLLKDLHKNHILSIIFSTRETRFIFYTLKSKSLKQVWQIIQKKNQWNKNIMSL